MTYVLSVTFKLEQKPRALSKSEFPHIPRLSLTFCYKYLLYEGTIIGDIKMAIQIKPHRVTIPCDHWVPSEVGKLITQFKIPRVEKNLIDKLMIAKHTRD